MADTVDKRLGALDSDELAQHADAVRGLLSSRGWDFLQQLVDVQIDQLERRISRHDESIHGVDDLVKRQALVQNLRGMVAGARGVADLADRVVKLDAKVQVQLETEDGGDG